MTQYFALPIPVAQKLMDYITKKPYQEVAGLIDEIKAQMRTINVDDEKPADPVEPASE